MYQMENSRSSFVEEISLWINFSLKAFSALKKAKKKAQEIYLISLGINFNVQIYFQMVVSWKFDSFPDLSLSQTHVYIIKPTSFEKYYNPINLIIIVF